MKKGWGQAKLLALSIAVALGGCAFVNSQKHQVVSDEQIDTLPRKVIDQTIEGYTRSFIAHQPGLATSLNLDEAAYGEYKSRWPDYSLGGMNALQRDMQQAVNDIVDLQKNSLTGRDRTHLEVNEVIARYYMGDLGFKGGYIDTWGGHLPFIVSQISGPLMEIPNLMRDQHSVTSEDDAKDYLARLARFAEVADEVRSKVESDAASGIILPKPLFPNTLKYLKDFVAPISTEHSLITTFVTKLNDTDLSLLKKAELLEEANSILKNKVYPAFGRVAHTMMALEKQAPEEVGIWAQPNGEQFYQHEITFLADSDLTAEEIHNIGLKEVERISQRMDKILKENGYAFGSVGDRMQQLNEESRFLFEDSDEGRQALLDYLEQEIRTISDEASSLFNTLPTQDIEVKRFPKEVEAGAPGGYYYAPSLDGTRPGVFAINLKDMKAVPKFGLKTLTYHEAVPGHHFQVSLNMLQTDIGLMRQNASFNGFIEGWALYSEQLAFEMGMYDDDPFGDLGRLQAEAYRAARLVVDTGLHYKRWSREEAIEYFAEATGSAMSDVESAIDRYIAWPGQALGYKLGMIKFVELRQNAEQALGDDFDIKAFHDLILLQGARPLALVEADVNRWIAQQKS